MTTNYPPLIGLTYFESEIEAVSLCEGESAALVQLRSSGKRFVRLPAQALELEDFIPGTSKENKSSHQSGGTAINSICTINISKLSLRPGEALASDMPKYSGHTLASVRIGDGVQLDLGSGNGESSGSESSVQITALPSWIGAGSAPAVLHMPTQDDSTVRVVLHKGAELSYPVSSTQQGLLPLVVERSTAAIQARNAITPQLLSQEATHSCGRNTIFSPDSVPS